MYCTLHIYLLRCLSSSISSLSSLSLSFIPFFFSFLNRSQRFGVGKLVERNQLFRTDHMDFHLLLRPHVSECEIESRINSKTNRVNLIIENKPNVTTCFGGRIFFLLQHYPCCHHLHRRNLPKGLTGLQCTRFI